MVRQKKAKSEHKTLRLTEQAKFSVTFLAQNEGQSGNAFVESAVHHYAKHLAAKRDLPLASIWHIDESIRQLRWFALSDAQYRFDDEQARNRDFVMRHVAFFYFQDAAGILHVNDDHAVELYPLLAQFRSVKGDHWAAGKAMAKHLKERGIEPPVWPPVNT